MAIINLQITSIMGGHSPLFHGAGEGQFISSLAIDPEASESLKPSGYILPVGYAKFSSSVPSGAPMWIVTNPVNQNHYVYGADGELYSYDSVLSSETSIGTPTSGAGNGSAYYNDYVYLATPTNVSRYGPLSGAAAIVNTAWTGATLGSQSALTNSTYPGTRNVDYPNHAMHVHTDGSLYFLDFASGQGMVHKIKTDSTGTNDGSAYNVLDLPFGVRPFDLEGYGTDLAVVGSVLGSSTTVKQGGSFLFLWDTFADSFYRQVPIPSAFASAIVNVGGTLYIWGGSIDFGWHLYRYTGGYDVEQLWDSHEGSPPYAGAVDTFGDRVAWGSYITGTPSIAACIMAYGYQNERLGRDAVHNIGVVDSLNTLPVVSSLKFAQQAQRTKAPIIGWRTDTSAAYGLSKVSAAAAKNSWFWSPPFQVNKPFKVREIRIPLTDPVTSTVNIRPRIMFDDQGTTKTLTAINNTNYPGESVVRYNDLEIEEATSAGYVGKNNFFLELQWDAGTSAIGVALPIDITIETLDD